MSADRLFTLANQLIVSASPCSGLRPVQRVLVTGAAGQIAYSLLPMICSGLMLGEDQPVILHLLDIPQSQEVLKGVVMELEDCAFPLLQGVVATTDPRVAFKGINVAMFVGAFPRQKGMERKDLLQKNASIFVSQGRILNELADPNVKVLVVGNPANTNCLLLAHSAPNIPRKNFSCLTRLDHHRALAQVANKVGVAVSQVHNVIIWGNHSATQYVDVNHGHITDHPAAGVATPIRSSVNDDAWVRQTFLPAVQKRGAEVIAARKLSSAASAAYASVQHVRSWLLGTAPGEIVSMGVISDGSYGVPEGLVFSFPVRCVAGSYTIVQGLPIDDFSREQIEITKQELIEERDSALTFA